MASWIRSTFSWSRLGFAFLLLLAYLAGLASDPVKRWAASEVFAGRYQELMFKCDHAMREHFLAKARAAGNPSRETADLLAEAEVGLLDCHRYDRLRKRLLLYGLTEDDLGAIGLEAMEAKGTDIRETVRQHEIRY